MFFLRKIYIFNSISTKYNQMYALRTLSGGGPAPATGFETKKPRPALEKAATDQINWRNALADAEILVQYPTPYSKLVELFNSDIAKTSVFMRKLVDSSHPVLRSTKNLLLGPKSNLQSMGLAILLLSRATGCDEKDFEDQIDEKGILHSQRALAEFVEIKRNSSLIQQVLSNQNTNEVKILLSGQDLSNLSDDNIKESCIYLTEEAIDLVLSAAKEIKDGEIIGDRDPNNKAIPSKPKDENDLIKEHYNFEAGGIPLNIEELLGQGKDEWSLRTMLSSGSMLAKACQAAMLLANCNTTVQKDAFIFGGHLSLVWQLCLDIKDFYVNLDSYSLVGAPVIFAIEEYPTIYEKVEPAIVGDKINYFDLRKSVKGTRAIEKTRDFLENEIETCLNFVKKLPQPKGRTILNDIILAGYCDTLGYLE